MELAAAEVAGSSIIRLRGLVIRHLASMVSHGNRPNGIDLVSRLGPWALRNATSSSPLLGSGRRSLLAREDPGIDILRSIGNRRTSLRGY